MGLGTRIGRPLRLSGARMRRFLTVSVVLALAATTGATVALTAPALLVNLGLAEPQEIISVPPPPIPEIGPLPGNAPRPTGEGVTAALRPGVTKMPGTFTGVVLDPADGRVLWQDEPDRAMTPGSTGKLLTAAAALLTLPSTDRLVTKVVAGPEPGTVVLIGGGDPTLTALPEGRTGVYPDPSRLADLAEQAKRAAGGPIQKVIIDTSRFTGPTLAEGWAEPDIQAGYVAPIEALMVDGGRIDPALQDGPRVSDPAATAGRAFAALVGADQESVQVGTAPPGARRLAEVSSAPVADLVEHLLRSSDNVLAEMLAREVARSAGAQPSFAGSAEQVLVALDRAGLARAGAEMHDGSGLSTQDRVPARLLGSVLAAAAAPATGPRASLHLRGLLGGLPVAGGDGTLDARFTPDATSAAGRGVVRAKTGTLTGVTSLAGLVTDADERLLVFALMSNGPSPADARPRLDTMAASLSRCGCR